MIEFGIEKLEVPPLVHSGDYVNPSTDPGGAQGSLIALVGVPTTGQTPVFDGTKFVPGDQISSGDLTGVPAILVSSDILYPDARILAVNNLLRLTDGGPGSTVTLGISTVGASEGQTIQLVSGAPAWATPSVSSGGSYTDEQAQDAVGAMVDSTLVYVDATPLLTRAALTGDVTAAQGSNATTITNDAVTYAKLQNISAASRLLGRGDSGAGDPQEIALGAGLLMSGTTLLASGSYTDEQAQDAVGGILTDTSTIDFTYDDASNTISAIVVAGSIGPTQLASTAVAAGTYGSSTLVPQITVDADGRLTNVTEIAVASTIVRTTTSFNAAAASNGQATGSITLAKGTAIFGISEINNRQCRVRLYGSSTARTADLARSLSTYPVAGSYPAGTGCTLDVVLCSDTSYAIDFDPKPIAGSPNDPPVSTVYYTVDNLTNVSLTLMIELRHTPFEG